MKLILGIESSCDETGVALYHSERGLLGRAAGARIKVALEARRRPDGKLPLTFEIIYGHAFRPVPKTTSGGESIVQWNLGKNR